MDVAARITRRAKAIADEIGVTLKAPPVKFLAPFFERASTESDADLEELWARLLVEAGQHCSGRMFSYIDVLAKMTKDEALALSDLAGLNTKNLGRPFEGAVYGANADALRDFAMKRLFINMEQPGHDQTMIDASTEFKRTSIVKAGRLLWFTTSMVFPSASEAAGGWTYHYCDEVRSTMGVYYGLEAKGLARIRHEDVVKPAGWKCSVSWVELTALGIDLERVVTGRPQVYGT